jgi:ferritin-like metal-binding protein YciE
MTASQILRGAFIEELKDLLSSKKQLLAVLPEVIRNVSSSTLRESLSDYLEQTSKHASRL